MTVIAKTNLMKFTKSHAAILILSLLGGFALTYGAMLANNESIEDFNIGKFLTLFFYTFILFLFNNFLFKKIDNRYDKTTLKNKRPFVKKNFFVLWGIIFALWLPVFLAYFPTIWTYDVESQFPAITEIQMSAQQPVLHTFFMEGIFISGNTIFGSQEAGMALLSIVQMLITSAIFAYAIEKISTFIPNKKTNKITKIALIIFFGLVPFNSIMSISMTKDTIFSGLFLLIILKIYDIIDAGYISRKNACITVLLCILMMLFKTYAIYAFTLFTIIAIFLVNKKLRLKTAVLCLTSLFSAFLINTGLNAITNANPAPSTEAWSVPVQSLICLGASHPELIPEYGSGGIIFGIAPRDDFAENFSTHCQKQVADGAKVSWYTSLDNGHTTKKDILKAWVKYGFKYPLDYIDIYGNMTLGAWYPYDTTHAEIYGGKPYLMTNFHDVQNFEVKDYDSKFPALKDGLETVATDSTHQKYPIISLIFAPATYVWVLIFVSFYLIHKKAKPEMIPIVLLLSLLAVILFGPGIMVRYMYQFMVAAPIVLIRTIYGIKQTTIHKLPSNKAKA
ncbi:MAG: DUF6020 family protein [Candidatus Saccharibacteria bacterium]|nr:DUF6020 family protein [Candidatus Saccharibacteria bacterium]